MASTKARIPAIDGWFTTGDDPCLIGSQCAECRTYFFPKEAHFCRNPHCDSTVLNDVPLSSRGTVWSFTVNHYPAPPPFVSAEPFTPYGIAAVELAAERMIVLGQIEGDSAGLHVGSEVELVVGDLYEDDDNEYVIWKWRAV